MKPNWNFLGVRGCKTENLLLREYGYFLELHNVQYFEFSYKLSCNVTFFKMEVFLKWIMDTSAKARKPTFFEKGFRQKYLKLQSENMHLNIFQITT